MRDLRGRAAVDRLDRAIPVVEGCSAINGEVAVAALEGAAARQGGVHRREAGQAEDGDCYDEDGPACSGPTRRDSESQ